MKGENWFIGVIFIVIGLSFLGFGVAITTDTFSSYVNRTAKAEGTVVGVKTHRLWEGSTSLPMVRFVTEGGRSIEFTSHTGSDLLQALRLRPSWKDRIGKSVTVRYDSADPTDARIDSFFQLWGGIEFPLIGGLLTFFGVRLLRSRSPVSPA